MQIAFGRNEQYKPLEYKFDPNMPQPYLDFLKARQDIIKLKAMKSINSYDKIRAKSYNKNIKGKVPEYEVGQRVLWNINSRYSGNKAKLGPRWIGPYEITDIFNNYTTFTIKVIPLPTFEQNKPLNRHIKTKKQSKPKISERRNCHEIEQFNVPRDQIKPYYESYESQFDGTQSPIHILINTITNTIKSKNERDQITSYQCLFHLYDQQSQMGYNLY